MWFYFYLTMIADKDLNSTIVYYPDYEELLPPLGLLFFQTFQIVYPLICQASLHMVIIGIFMINRILWSWLYRRVTNKKIKNVHIRLSRQQLYALILYLTNREYNCGRFLKTQSLRSFYAFLQFIILQGEIY